jgi:hypothetical protein
MGTGGSDMSQALGQLLLNYTFVTTIPSWLNEKREEVSVPRAIWGSTIPCSAAYLIMGVLGTLLSALLRLFTHRILIVFVFSLCRCHGIPQFVFEWCVWTHFFVLFWTLFSNLRVCVYL